MTFCLNTEQILCIVCGHYPKEITSHPCTCLCHVTGVEF